MSRIGKIPAERIPFGDAPQGTCRWCGDVILHKDGTQNRRRRWHPDCHRRFNEEVWRFHYETRPYHRDRDHGVCGACGLDTADFLKQVELAASTRAELREILRGLGFDFGRRRPVMWHVDHLVPLVDGGRHVPENTWTLCVPCHKAKTAEEAARRAGLCEAFRASDEYQALRAPRSLGRAAREEHSAAWEAFLSRYSPPRDPETAKHYWKELLCQTRS